MILIYYCDKGTSRHIIDLTVCSEEIVLIVICSQHEQYTRCNSELVVLSITIRKSIRILKYIFATLKEYRLADEEDPNMLFS